MCTQESSQGGCPAATHKRQKITRESLPHKSVSPLSELHSTVLLARQKNHTSPAVLERLQPHCDRGPRKHFMHVLGFPREFLTIKLTPKSWKAMLHCSNASSSVFCSPHVIVPRHTLLTTRSLFPSWLYL